MTELIISEDLMDIMSKNKIRYIPIVENKVLLEIFYVGNDVKKVLEKFILEN